MNNIVKDSMVSLSDYPTISETATLQEALLALENAKTDHGSPEDSPHWIVLVLDEEGKVSGKLSQLNVLTALESNNDGMKNIKEIGRFGFSQKFVTGLREEAYLKSASSDRLFIDSDILEMSVKEFMSKIVEKDFIDETTSLANAAHQMASRRRISMLVTSEDEVVGVLRLSDVFTTVIANVKNQQS